MWTVVLVSLLLNTSSEDAPQAKEPPAKRELFAQEDWYKGQKGEARTFVGVVERAGRPEGVVGFGRNNPYRLVMEEKGKKSVREIYVGGKPELLAPYVGKKVKLTGKAVDMEVEGRQHHEIWPARIEVVAAKKAEAPTAKDEKDRDLKILARGAWPVRHEKPTQLVVRNAEELALAHGIAPRDAREKRFQADVTADVALLLKVKAIDWDKQMLAIVSAGMKRTGGYRVEVLALPVKDGTLTVRWKLHSPAPGGIVTQAITYPAEMILVERVDGTVKFDPPAKAEGKNK